MTTLIPCANVDLFITDSRHRLLLTWRDDRFTEEAGIFPAAACVYRKHLKTEFRKQTRREIGTEVIYNPDSFITREAIVVKERPWLKNQLERSHNISMLFDCRLPKMFRIKNNVANEHTVGFYEVV